MMREEDPERMFVNDGQLESLAMFAFDRPTRVREGKHIRFNGEKSATIVRVGK